MGRSKTNKKGRNEAPRDAFTRVPHSVQNSPAFASLTPNGRTLLLEILSMHNGENNGSLWLSVRDAAHRMGLASVDSARAAFSEIESAGFLRMTKDAHFSVKSAETSRARCWRITFLHAPGTGITDEWRSFEPTDNAARRRMQRGLEARATYRKAKAQEKLPVLDSGTIKAAGQKIPARAVPKSGTAKPANDRNPPKFVVPDSCTHVAITIPTGVSGVVWREAVGLDGRRLSARVRPRHHARRGMVA